MQTYTNLSLFPLFIPSYKESLTPSLSNHLKQISIRCNNITQQNNIESLSSSVQKNLILIFSSKQNYNMNKDQLYSWLENEAINNILGHAYILYNKVQNKEISGIYDLCIHTHSHFDLGFSYKFIDVILDSILINISSQTILWIGIDINNQNFQNNINLLASHNFDNPFISNKDPFGNTYINTFMGLSKNNDYIHPSQINKQIIISKINYTIDQYFNNLTCTIKLFFNIIDSKWLKKLVLAASSLNPKTNTVTQKEVSGAFSLKGPYNPSNQNYIWEISVNKTHTLISNSEDKAEIINSKYSFHTHPKELYDTYNVNIGFPSGDDFLAFLFQVLNYNTIFHSIITLEGVYTLSINKYWTIRINKLKKIIQKGGNKLKKHIKNITEIPKIVINNIEEEARLWPNKINLLEIVKDKPSFFYCYFLSWNDIENKEIISINYPVLNNQCFATELSLKAYNKLSLQE